MKYTINNTPRDVIDDNIFKSTAGFFDQDFVKENSDELDKTFNEQYDYEGAPFYMESWIKSIVWSINVLKERVENGENIFIPIWEGLSEVEKEETKDTFLIPFLIDKKSPCVIVCPGGGYYNTFIPAEGVQTAMALNDLGYNAVILTYRCRHCHYPKPQRDLIRAIRYVRVNKKQFHLLNNKVIILGYSAAGHLCGSVAALYDCLEDPTHQYDKVSARPDAVVLSYPVISLLRNAHMGSVIGLLGENPEDLDRYTLSVQNLVTSNYPPTFIWHCLGDTDVLPANTVMMDESLSRHNVKHETHLYPNGGHGCGLAKDTEAENWLPDAMKFVAKNI